MLNGTICHHLEKFKFKEHLFVWKFLEDLYVDDTTSGCDSVEKGIEFYTKAKEVMEKAGFSLHECITNNREFSTPDETKNIVLDDTSCVKLQFSDAKQQL